MNARLYKLASIYAASASENSPTCTGYRQIICWHGTRTHYDAADNDHGDSVTHVIIAERVFKRCMRRPPRICDVAECGLCRDS